MTVFPPDQPIDPRVSSSDSEALAARLTRLEGALEAEFSKIETRFAQLSPTTDSKIDEEALRKELREELLLEIWDEVRPELSQLRTELEALADRPAAMGPDRGGFTPLHALHGVGQKLATPLEGAGVKTVSDLLVVAATEEGRKRLLETGLTEGRLRHLYQQADLLRLHGIGQGEVLLLEAVGVSDTATLATQSPRDLYERLVAQSEQAESVPPPALGWVESWVVQAKRLPPVARW